MLAFFFLAYSFMNRFDEKNSMNANIIEMHIFQMPMDITMKDIFRNQQNTYNFNNNYLYYKNIEKKE